VQALARLTVGVQGASPLLAREVVELVASLRARDAMSLRHRKMLLRRLVALRAPASLAWRPKREPLGDWLVMDWIRREANVQTTVAQIRGSPMLQEIADAEVFASSAAKAAKGAPSAAAVVEFAALAQWVAAMEAALLAG
jgi:hypothetical protein